MSSSQFLEEDGANSSVILPKSPSFMTVGGIASANWSGKVRWWPSSSHSGHIRVSPAGVHLTSLTVSSDNQWLIYARKNTTELFAIKLQDASDEPLSLPFVSNPSKLRGSRDQPSKANIMKSLSSSNQVTNVDNHDNDFARVIMAIHVSACDGDDKKWIVYAGDHQGQIIRWTLSNQQGEHSPIYPHLLHSSHSLTSELDHMNLDSSSIGQDHQSTHQINLMPLKFGSITCITSWPQHHLLFVAIQNGTRIVQINQESGKIVEHDLLDTVSETMTTLVRSSKKKSKKVVSPTPTSKLQSQSIKSNDPNPNIMLCPTPPIHSMSVACHLNSLIVASDHRHLTVYPCDANGIYQPQRSLQYLACDFRPIQIDVSPTAYDRDTHQHVLGVHEFGKGISIWRVSYDEEITSSTSKRSKPIQPHARINLITTITSKALNTSTKKSKSHKKLANTPEESPCHILGARFSTTDHHCIIVSFGIPTCPFFSTIPYLTSDGAFIPEQSLNTSQRQEQSVLSNARPLSTNLTSLDQGSFSSLTKINTGDIDHSNHSRLDHKMQDNSQVNIIGSCDMPLSNSSCLFEQDSNEAMQVDQDDDSIDMHSKTTQTELPLSFGQLIQKEQSDHPSLKEAAPMSNTPLLVNSAHTALTGALSANDSALLRTILDQQDEKFIISTLQLLPVTQVLPLLTALLFAFTQSSTSTLISWTRHLLIIHQSYLASTPGILEKLSGLYNVVDERLQHYPDLLKLSGRFDLLLAHIDHTKTQGQASKAIQTYNESEDELDMLQVDQGNELSDSDDSSETDPVDDSDEPI